MEKTVRHFGNIHQVNGILHVKPEVHEDGITRFINSKRFSKHKKPNHGMGIIENNNSKMVLYQNMFFSDLEDGIRFYGKPMIGKYGMMYQLSVRVNSTTARVLWTNQIYHPEPTEEILLQRHIELSLIIKQSPERATQMATTKKASKKASAAKKTSVKKSDAGKKTAGKKTESKSTTKREGPTKKEMVAKYLKDGKKAQEIVDAMAKDGVTTTLASVRCFIQAINNGQ